MRGGDWIELPLTFRLVNPMSTVTPARPTDRLRTYSICIGHHSKETSDIGTVTEWPVISLDDRAAESPTPKPIWTAHIGSDRVEGFYETRGLAVEAVITRAAMAGGSP